MERLPKDVLIMLALDLSNQDILHFCSTSKKINLSICNNNTFWMKKLNKEYPFTIGKFKSNSDFHKIYLSLLNKEVHTYYIFISNENTDKIPKIYSYIKNTPITDEDYELAEHIYTDFNERHAEENKFEMIGNFPLGTKIWVAFSDDPDTHFIKGFLDRNEAVEEILKIANYFVENDFHLSYDFIDEIGKTPEEFYGGTLEEVKKKNFSNLTKNNYLVILGHDDRLREPIFPINFIIKEFELIDYGEILKELKMKNPNWRKLPNDIIQYILKFFINK